MSSTTLDVNLSTLDGNPIGAATVTVETKGQKTHGTITGGIPAGEYDLEHQGRHVDVTVFPTGYVVFYGQLR
jgi:hypothetical protein